MITTNIDMTGFTQGMAGLVRATGETMRVVVEKETGELVKELVRRSLPKNLKKSGDAIKKTMAVRFDIAKTDSFNPGTPSFSGDVNWVFSNDKFLYGIKPDLDMRRATAEEVALKFMTSRTRKSGASRWLFSFKHPREKQKVSITQRVTVLQKTADKAARLLALRFGKLKASWLAAAGAAVRITGGRFPAWVLRHVPTAKGRSTNGLNNPGAPFFEIISSASGVGTPDMSRIIKSAIATRAFSMKKNAELFASGVKHLGDYATGKALR
jgi:hypothetical protein